jgi:murein L,D-transpeptidase YcbB/YkuD
VPANGQYPASALAPIGGGYYLARGGPAESWNAMAAESTRRWGRRLAVVAAYRTYAKQVYFWNLYRSGQGNLAAYPGTSNHGTGHAVDCASQWDRWAIDQIGARYGWAKRCSDAQSEWWHIIYNPTCTGAGPIPKAGPAGPRVLRQGMSGNDVREVQTYLLRGGYLHRKDAHHPAAIDGSFGHSTKAAVQKFQREHHLKADGVVGPATIKALRAKYKRKK